MVTVAFDPHFERSVRKIKDSNLKERVKKQIQKIIKQPEIGKPMRYTRKNIREVYVSPFRLSYLYLKKEDKLIVLELYHKDEQ
ncbi:MAG: type II toxin-antitoxin system RelE/ParE family toxin [Candidatus Altiarchaeales archaeon]|nr:type II toxin-antitoxin system RelE/ParE family toxin [Candidatus Altiarchaeales archaeon]